MINFIMIDSKLEEINIDYFSNKLEETLGVMEKNHDINIHLTTEEEEEVEVFGKEEYSIKINEKEYYCMANIKQVRQKIHMLDIKIIPTSKENGFDNALYDLKLHLKNSVIKDWKECVWLKDSQSNNMSEKLYGKIHKLENQLRQIINIAMIRRYGLNWWDYYAPTELTDKYNNRKVSYKKHIFSFKDVHDYLLAVDTNDLSKIMTHQTKKISINDESLKDIEDLIHITKIHSDPHKLFKTHEKIVRKLQIGEIVQKDIWEEVFEEYFGERGFLQKWEELCKRRNHVAHNKIIDLVAFKQIEQKIEELQELIDDAENILEEQMIKEEIMKEGVGFEEIEDELVNEYYNIQYIREDTGLNLLDEEEIMGKFEKEVDEFLSELFELSHLELMTESTEYALNFASSFQNIYSEHVLLEIIDEIYNREFKLVGSPDINDEQGSLSTYKLVLYINGEERLKCELTYENGEAIYDSDIGIYSVKIEDYFDNKDFINFAREFRDLIITYLPNYAYVLDDEEFEALNNGQESPKANMDCENCEEAYVSKDEKILKEGYCGICGHYNESYFEQ